MNQTLNPYWITGFSDAEACFHVSFTKRLYRKVKIEVRPSFSITQQSRSRALLEEFRQFFQCGAIRFSRKDGFYRYEIRSISDLFHHILPHFSTYPLRSPKKEEFEKFQKICLILKQHQHLSSNHLKKILDLAYSMNVPGKRRYEKEDLLKLIMS